MSRNLKDSDNKKLSKKDIAIIALSIILFILLIVIIIMSRRRDQMIANSLEQNSEVSTDEIKNSVTSSMDDLEISEINADKWLELHNTGTEAIDISGLQIKVSDILLATIGSGTVIKKDGYYVAELNANPGKSDQNVMTIYDSTGEIVKFFLIPKLNGEQSFGLIDSETNIWGYFEPTKGKKNSATDVHYVENGGIGMSAPGGFYNTSFDLELTCSENEKIYYTTDGSAPTMDSQPYDGKIYVTNKSGSNYVYANLASYDSFHFVYSPRTVDSGMIVRAIKVNASGETTGELSQAYFIGLTKDSDYLNLPVISITTDPENLFDYEKGIYIAGKAKEDALIQGLEVNNYANYYNPWKRPARIEYYESTKDKTFEADVNINIDTDPYCAALQKGLIISIDDDSNTVYKGSSIFDFISSDGQLRLTQNYEDNDIKVRNYFAQELAEEYGIDVQKCRPCVVFIDGEYWGLYTIRSYVNESYFIKKYNLGNQEILIHNAYVYSAEYDSFYDFATQNDLSIDANYEQVKNMLDVDSFIDYVCFNVFLGNSSFSPSRGTAWRTASTGTGVADGKWRFISGDLSSSLNLTARETPTINTFLQPGIQGDLLLQSLLMNEQFCKQFENRMKKISIEVFDYEKCSEKLEDVVSLIKKPAMASYERFTGTLTDGMYTTDIEMIKSFLESRPEVINAYTSELAANGGDLQKAREMIREQEDTTEVLSDENALDEEAVETPENGEEIADDNVNENPEENVNG